MSGQVERKAMVIELNGDLENDLNILLSGLQCTPIDTPPFGSFYVALDAC